MEETKLVFNKPVQVAFWDYDGQHWNGGIAYGREIICGCCGGIFEIDEIYEFAPTNINRPILPYDDWVDISAEIIGFNAVSENFLDNP